MYRNQQVLLKNWENITQIIGNYYEKNEIGDFKIQIDNFIMRVPLIGLFSAGKSTLLNRLLDENLLSVEITPETCIATELYYASNSEAECFYEHLPNGTTLKITKDILIQKTKNDNHDVTKQSHSYVSAHLHTPVLASFPHICLVDLPGLESNLISHTQMIDDYIQKSLAYCIVVSIEDGELRASTQQFLQELKANNTPVLLVITKSDTKPDDDVASVSNKIQESVTQVLGQPPLKTVTVSARKRHNLNEVIDAFVLLERKSEEQFDYLVTKPILSHMLFLIQNIDKLIETSDLSLEQLQLEKDGLNQEIEVFQKSLQKDTERLEIQVRPIIDHISFQLESRLISQLDVLAQTLLNEQDISTAIDNIVRLTVSEGLQDKLAPLIQKYIKNVEQDIPESIKVDTANMKFETNDDIDGDFNFANIATMLSPALKLLKFNPTITVISMVIVPILANILGSFLSDKKRKEQQESRLESAKQAILIQIIPKIKLDVQKILSNTIMSNIESAKKTMSDIANERCQQVQSRIEQKEADIQVGREEQQKRITKYKADKKTLETIIEQLRNI